MFRFHRFLRERWGTLEFGEKIHPVSENTDMVHPLDFQRETKKARSEERAF